MSVSLSLTVFVLLFGSVVCVPVNNEVDEEFSPYHGTCVKVLDTLQQTIAKRDASLIMDLFPEEFFYLGCNSTLLRDQYAQSMSVLPKEMTVSFHPRYHIAVGTLVACNADMAVEMEEKVLEIGKKTKHFMVQFLVDGLSSTIFRAKQFDCEMKPDIF
ncbi:hypothetical protein GCK72_022092 [Caenorhabditis remanei]|uniref:NTF2-like domain-containing protein n=2 Tax=Caenorhabditis remanei TaxID=31234 RepID=A0A6A5FT04_CAERE|nr:hypothetical protein GCK72_022092 [Caenorhabditis remanei]KAF1745645.1 hypothetical protein GCK72_022092 [Caenorhabditis remanei]